LILRGSSVNLVAQLINRMQFENLHVFFGLAWILMGILWIRRAYMGEKAGTLITLKPSSDHAMNRRERMFAPLLGGANLLLGIAELIFARH
jgi:hypothetical protein